MFYLTPQERSVLAAVLAVCLLGSLMHLAWTRHFRVVRWMDSTARHAKPHLPDINSAPAPVLDRVPGIGPKTAQAIVDYRRAHGPFTSLEGLRRVKGITPERLRKIREHYAQHGAGD